MISRSFAENQEYPPLTSTKISKFREKSEISDLFQTNIIRLSEIQTLAEISDLRISTDNGIIPPPHTELDYLFYDYLCSGGL